VSKKVTGLKKMNPEKCLIRAGFLECLVRCAKDKYDLYKPNNHEGVKSISEAMKKLFQQHLIPHCKILNYNVTLTFCYSNPIHTFKTIEMENLAPVDRRGRLCLQDLSIRDAESVHFKQGKLESIKS